MTQNVTDRSFCCQIVCDICLSSFMAIFSVLVGDYIQLNDTSLHPYFTYFIFQELLIFLCQPPVVKRHISTTDSSIVSK